MSSWGTNLTYSAKLVQLDREQVRRDSRRRRGRRRASPGRSRAGLTPAGAGSSFDRQSLRLPGGQDELVRRVAAVNDRTVVVVNAVASVEVP